MKIETVSPFEKDESLFHIDFLKNKLQSFKEIINDPNSGFFHLPKDEALLESSIELHKKYQNITEFVHIGIGGSSLGPEMLISALATTDTKFTFINNIDPEKISDQLKKINIENALFFFVSKSGGTAELTAGMSIIINWLEAKGLSQDQWTKKFVFCTDPQKSILLDLGRELDIPTLSIPSNIGGRFSVLTPVGIFPALFAGIDIHCLMEGAIKACDYCLDEDVQNNPLLNTASYLYDLKNFEINQTVFMPYSSKLRDFCFWFVQLWAESLGKKNDLNGEEIYTGLTPVPAYGATDQHSQMQLFMEGPLDKCLLLLEVEKFSTDYKLNSSINFPSFKKLNGHGLSELMKAELYGTIMALKEMGRPFIHFKVDRNDPSTMGELIIFFESLTALMGNYLNINPFDQPGVELGKVYAYQNLEKN